MSLFLYIFVLLEFVLLLLLALSSEEARSPKGQEVREEAALSFLLASSRSGISQTLQTAVSELQVSSRRPIGNQDDFKGSLEEPVSTGAAQDPEPGATGQNGGHCERERGERSCKAAEERQQEQLQFFIVLVLIIIIFILVLR